jgi:lipid II:glycine glycyltransferase (peptidoglycan interpeptide bridge formation enzyme)
VSGATPDMQVTADASSAPVGWDARAVAIPGGHVMQSATWGMHRATLGFEPHFLTFDDERVALALSRRSSGLPGSEVLVRRGPAHADEASVSSAARATALAVWARQLGARTLFLDPERPADPEYAQAMEEVGFSVADELEPSIHVMRRTFEPGLDEEALLRSFSKSTRQRIRAAEQAGVTVAESDDPERMAAFAELLHERADVVGMQLQAGTGFIETWRDLIAADLGRLLLAHHEDELVGGLFLFHQGGMWATAYSADKAERRRELPGTMHLVRWTAIRAALAEGCPAIELGGVDLPGHRRPPEKGDPNRGLYEHKRGFGAEWVEREPARRIVLRPHAERLASVRRRAIDSLRGMRRWRA